MNKFEELQEKKTMSFFDDVGFVLQDEVDNPAKELKELIGLYQDTSDKPLEEFNPLNWESRGRRTLSFMKVNGEVAGFFLLNTYMDEMLNWIDGIAIKPRFKDFSNLLLDRLCSLMRRRDGGWAINAMTKDSRSMVENWEELGLIDITEREVDGSSTTYYFLPKQVNRVELAGSIWKEEYDPTKGIAKCKAIVRLLDDGYYSRNKDTTLRRVKKEEIIENSDTVEAEIQLIGETIVVFIKGDEWTVLPDATDEMEEEVRDHFRSIYG